MYWGGKKGGATIIFPTANGFFIIFLWGVLEGDPSLIMSDFIGPLNVFFCYLMQLKHLLRFLGDTFEEMAERLEGQEYGK